LATEPEPVVVRNNRRTRLVHSAVFVVTTVLLVTGWWLLTGREGHHSLPARLAGETDAALHRKAGWVLVALAVAVVTVGARGAISFLRETLRVDRGDGRWFARWPAAALGRGFAHHRGHFDPGQRVANVAFVVVLGTLVGTGVALTTLHGGPAFVWLVRIHRYATYIFVVLAVGHVLVASGVLPGYRGVWRAMHLGGRVPAATVRRLWPESHQHPTDPPVPGLDERIGVGTVPRERDEEFASWCSRLRQHTGEESG
jgi:cytochrome b subunit of formate dehydrogenase